MKIAEVSKRYGISADTLRYYERIGILQGIPRNASGIRDYNEANCKTVEFVKCMRDAGMSIEALTEYMDLFYRGDETMERRKAILQSQREDIRRRIVELEDALGRLDYKIDHYEDIMEHERDILK
ncbi:MerR family transcriptional regulator [Enterorhabdus sp. P55]|jgi:DNA-binding transcriptional MerR regulator|uniref:MerR family transcriptional regulator n=1 Tax=Enterorhabdus sp. P55 TaxID=2304571 RepID=UPI001368A2DB|nr:MerR family transcriptional regulator [Enterorhabdus sp. P55]MCI8452918.1 MerR family transcriptional regulator [Eggerthellaceae bacterium]NBI31623.1 MerR family transcriptional regulator [Enterorhabdus sp. P55]